MKILLILLPLLVLAGCATHKGRTGVLILDGHGGGYIQEVK